MATKGLADEADKKKITFMSAKKCPLIDKKIKK